MPPRTRKQSWYCVVIRGPDLQKRHRFLHRAIAAEISATTRYYDTLIQAQPLVSDGGAVLECIDCPNKALVQNVHELPDFKQTPEQRCAVLLNGNLNHDGDIQRLLQEIRAHLFRTSRVVVVAYNPYLRWVYRWAGWLRLRKGPLPTTFLTRTDLDNLNELSGFEIVRERWTGYFPFWLLGLGNAINAVMPLIPLLRGLGFAAIYTLRPRMRTEEAPSLSVVIPARNEKGNIENALKQLPPFSCKVEIIFVEGHSSDGTWEEILRVQKEYGAQFDIQVLRQEGKGKGDAVRLGFGHAKGDLLTVLDADLTMPPELLTRFYHAYRMGLADFINGTRLVYPMEGKAMRFLNRLGNVFFAKALSGVLGVRVGDSLCGTKLLRRDDYARMVRWRADFGDFDPFGDFELLFPAAVLALGVRDVPIRYLARKYGTTNILRFRHGWMLLRMTLIGLFRIRLGKRA